MFDSSWMTFCKINLPTHATVSCLTIWCNRWNHQRDYLTFNAFTTTSYPWKYNSFFKQNLELCALVCLSRWLKPFKSSGFSICAGFHQAFCRSKQCLWLRRQSPMEDAPLQHIVAHFSHLPKEAADTVLGKTTDSPVLLRCIYYILHVIIVMPVVS